MVCMVRLLHFRRCDSCFDAARHLLFVGTLITLLGVTAWLASSTVAPPSLVLFFLTWIMLFNCCDEELIGDVGV